MQDAKLLFPVTYIGDPLEKVLDVATDGPDGSDLLLLTEPLLNLKPMSSLLRYVTIKFVYPY